jgi:replicative DNA helicase
MNLLIIAARPGMGKCLAGDTEVLDPKTGALTTIQALVGGSEDHGTHHVATLDIDRLRLDVAAPFEYHDNGVRETFEVRTRLGRRIVATANHPLLTIDGWQELRELRVGDAIAVPRHLEVFGVDERPDAEVALLGYLIGDGNLTNATPRFTNTDPRIVADATAWAAEMGLELQSEGGDDRPTYRLVAANATTLDDVGRHAGVSGATASMAMRGDTRTASKTRRRVASAADMIGYRAGRRNPLGVLLDETGLNGCDAHTKFIPDAVYRLPRRQVALFLSRLFAADGSAWTANGIYRIEFTSASERLARGVQHLLLRFGVVAKLRERRVAYRNGRRRAFDISFQDPESVVTFAERIGIFGKEAQVDRVKATAAARARAQSAHSLLPLAVWDVVLEEKGLRTWASISAATGRPRNHNWHVRTRRLSRRLIGELAEALDSDRLRALATSDVVWDPIVAVEPAGRQRTFDLTVPGHANFVAGDVVVHNSALALNIAQNIAVHDEPVAIFSLEMSREEVVTRMLCASGRIDSQRLRSGRLTEADFTKLSNAASTLYKKPIYVDDSAGMTVTEIRAKCRRLRRKPGLSLVVVDYLQLMQGSSGENRQQEIAEISRSLKNLARELEVPVIALSQLNRALEAREDKRPRLSDLRESGSLEQDADVVMFIYRHEYYHPEAQETRGTAEVAVAKHRQGATGRVDMTFLPEFTLFADMGRDIPVV